MSVPLARRAAWKVVPLYRMSAGRSVSRFQEMVDLFEGVMQ